jgi:hypothetical protein
MDMDAERLLKNLLKENRTETPEEALARNVANMVEALENEGFEREESIAIAISLITAVIKGQTNGSI